MNRIRYERASAERIFPLLASIALEIEERQEALARIEQVRATALDPELDPRRREWDACESTHRREVRHALEEVGRLGCALVGMHPPTFIIPTRSAERGPGTTSLVFQAEEHPSGSLARPG